MLLSQRNSYPSVEELAQPELRIAGLRFNPNNFALSRQNLPYANKLQLDEISKGGYVLREPKKKAKGVIIATGSEVQLALAAQEKLGEQGIHVRVVSAAV